MSGPGGRWNRASVTGARRSCDSARPTVPASVAVVSFRRGVGPDRSGRVPTSAVSGFPPDQEWAAGPVQGTIGGMYVNLAADGAVVADADDCTRLHLATALDGPELRVALRDTGTGQLAPDGAVWLDVAVLRSRGQLVATVPDWPQRWDGMIAYAGKAGWLSEDGRSVRVHIER